ncbi:MAG: DUF2390 domain-containing protein [Gammaproteobacteria bacterium]|nr:DUF2390 domain-containing protein [Gammaproteobacteria bacterium]
MKTSVETHHPFLTFAEQLTSQSLVRQALLRLQDEQHVCANLLIYLIWLAVTGRGRLQKSLLRHLISCIAPWNIAILRTLQDFSTTLENHLQTRSLSTTVNPLVIHAEQSEQQILLQTPLGLHPRQRTRQQQLHDACQNIVTYVGVSKVNVDMESLQALNVVLQAAFPECQVNTINTEINQVLTPSQMLNAGCSQLELERL